MTGPTQLLMIAVLAGDDAVAAAAWRQWRATADIQTAPWQQLQLLPLIPRVRFQPWLIDDADANRLNGIIRRAWTESQLHLAAALEAVTCISNNGCTVGVFGSTGIHLHLGRLGSIYPITDLRLLIPRADCSRAIQALDAVGWRLHSPLSAADTMDWQTNIALSRGNSFLHLHWRALDVPAHKAKACEREFLSVLRPVSGPHDLFRILSPGHELLIALADAHLPTAETRLPWQLDAGLLIPHVDSWERWAALAGKYTPSALPSIGELRDFAIAISDLPSPRPPSVFMQRLQNAVRWRGRRMKRKLQDLLHTSEDHR